MFYEHTGRTAEWSRLGEEIVPDFVDPATEGPLPGREEPWSLVTQYRVGLGRKGRLLDKAERLQSVDVGCNRQRVVAVFAKAPQAWTVREKNAVRSLGSSLHGLSEVQREQGSAKCVDGYLEIGRASCRER